MSRHWEIDVFFMDERNRYSGRTCTYGGLVYAVPASGVHPAKRYLRLCDARKAYNALDCKCCTEQAFEIVEVVE